MRIFWVFINRDTNKQETQIGMHGHKQSKNSLINTSPFLSLYLFNNTSFIKSITPKNRTPKNDKKTRKRMLQIFQGHVCDSYRPGNSGFA